MACAFGYTVGHLVGSRWFTAPGTALAYFGLFVLVQSAPLPYGFRSLFPAIANRDTEFARYITATMWGQSAFFLAVSALLLLAARCTHFPRERWHVLAATAAVVTGCLAGSVVVGTNGQYVAGYNPRDFVCAGEAPEICVNRGYQEGLEGLRGRFDALYAKAAGTSLLATRVEQNVEGVGDLPAPGARSIYIEGVDAEGLDQTVGRYVEKYGGFAACDLEHVPYDTLMATIIVDTWLSGFDDYDPAELDPATPAGREWKALSVLSAESGNRWLRDHERAYLTCALSLDDLP
ncbi:MAG: hypothetical protein P0Y48_11065 [Candidatus Microbacterium phytovorans]|uniref:Uncharacterized protein n=1 Tax=Candidatus Microbacterium phytovorans TaxID=3121374 RepID=A0AAJ5W0J1_9MICO|nr:hypothetical protein [Microbacterium sp.]WEK12998.1 MAG: hypothetical protein P0Y48_11065 [Microbacterium sp.]